MTEPEEEERWLRFFIYRLRAVLRYAKTPAVQVVLRELITEAERRLAQLEARRRQQLQTR